MNKANALTALTHNIIRHNQFTKCNRHYGRDGTRSQFLTSDASDLTDPVKIVDLVTRDAIPSLHHCGIQSWDLKSGMLPQSCYYLRYSMGQSSTVQ